MGKEAITKELEKRRIPELLRLSDNTPVDTPQLWETRRKEIRDILQKECYGYIPESGWETEWETVSEEENAFGGKARMRTVDVRIRSGRGYVSYPFQLTVPKNIEKPPLFLYLSFFPLSSAEIVEEITDNGFSVARVSYQDIAPDQNDGFQNGPGSLFPGNAYDSWGKLGVWAWGLSRIMDYLVQEETIDAGRVAVVGHSRLGKAALLCGAMDVRFSLVIACESGAGGAALFRGKEGENVADLCRNFPYWFCGNFKKWQNREEELPFDQHFTAALAAPRHLYLAGAVDDEWADPLSEFLTGQAVTPVYEMLGQQGLAADRLPSAGDVFHEGRVGFHLRPGTHYMGRDDWKLFMEYRKKQGV